MNKILIVTPGYPSDDNLYNNAFVHARVKEYIKAGLDIHVFSIDKNKKENYIFEDVNVTCGNNKKLAKMLNENTFEKILVHFGWKKIMNTILKSSPDTPIIIWVHGVEALGWYRRLFNFRIKEIHKFIGYTLFNTRQMLFMRSLIKKHQDQVTFVFVSNWMKNILEKDTLCNNKIHNYEIIPNVINDKKFVFQEKNSNLRYNILSIRPYASKKYANDISVDVILKLSKKEYFDKLNFYFFGSGRLFNKTLKPLVNFKNVKIDNRFLNHDEIVKMHQECGLLLTPTRQDAQGVSMCEGMSSGLIPITSNNTAIPEFVDTNGGFLCDNSDEMVNAIESMIFDEKKFLEMSKYTAKNIRKICSVDVVIKKEIDLITKK